MPKLSVRKVETLKKPGEYGDGEGLFLLIGPTGSKSWVLRTVVHGKRRKFGLGGASLVGLADARESARELRKVARSGGDPDTIRKRESLTFWDAAERVHAQLVPTWRNPKHARIWLSTVRTYAKPKFGDRPLHTIGSADILSALSPIWTDKHETAKRLRQRLSTIFDWAKGAGHYPHENPVNGLKKALPTVRRKTKHRPAMDWRDIPEFMMQLANRDGVSARALEFIILTAARSGEARGARWSEINAGVWTVPAERMKRGVLHRVPISRAAEKTLAAVRGLDSEYCFPSATKSKDGQTRPQSVMVFKSLYGRMEIDGFTTHGFRSSFRDWASESAHASREVAEAALSHAVGNEVEQAYARSDLFDRRVKLMDAWGRFCAGDAGTVVKFAGS